MTTQGQVVAKAGDAPAGLAPGVAIGVTSATSIFDNAINCSNGSVLVRARLTGTGVGTANDRALFLGQASGDLRAILRADDLDPSGTLPNSHVVQTGSTGSILGSNTFGNYRLAASTLPPFGEYILTQAQLHDAGLDGLILSGTGANNQVLYWGPPGGLTILARRNITTMPDGAVLIPDSLGQQSSALNGNGIAIFKTTLSATLGTPVPAVTTANDTAYIIGSPGLLNYLIREGDLLFGGTLAQGALGFTVALNEAGQVIHDETFSTTLGSTPATTANDKVILITTGGVHQILVREGDPAVDAAGAPITGVFYGSPTIGQGFSASGKASFQCNLTGAVTTANDGAVFYGDTSLIQMVVREGDIAPGTGGLPIGVINSGSGLRSSEYGVVCGATLTGAVATNDSIMLLGRPGQAAISIAREGDPAPGMPAGYVFGDATGNTNFGSSSVGSINASGHILFSGMRVYNGVTELRVTYSWDPVHGLQPQSVENDVISAVPVNFTTGSPIQFSSGDDSPLNLNHDGDFVMSIGTGVTSGNFVARGHIGTMNCSPSSVPVAGGVPQNFSIDVGPANANSFYFVLATSLGTRPGFPSPLGPQNIPLNFDPLWTNLSLQAANSSIWINSVGFTDANGKGLGPSGFVMPPGYPGFLGTTIHHSALIFDLTITSTFVTEPSALKFY